MNHSLDDLETLAREFNTDKQAKDNAYLPLYLQYFERQGMKRDKPLHILEIGTNKGSSLRMWAEYFPNAQVYGLDITRQYEIPGMLDHDRIYAALVNQSDQEAVCDVLDDWGLQHEGDIDIIIDDGSHEQSDQQRSLGFLFPYVVEGGLYIVEDVITGENWWSADQYNKERIMVTRAVLQTFEQTGKLESSAMNRHKRDYILNTYDYCEYRESPARVFGAHHPQLVFIGKV